MDQCKAIVKASVQRKSDSAGGQRVGSGGRKIVWEKKIRGKMKKVWDVWQESCPLVWCE